MSEAHFGRSQLDGLIDSLLQVPGLAHRDARDARVHELRSALKRPFDPPRHDAVQDDLAGIIAACVAASGGLRTLARIVHQHHPGEASSRFAELANDVVGPVLLAQPDRDQLRAILTGISIVDIADAVGVIGDVPELRTLQIWRDIPAAIRVMERLPLPETGVPPLLAFVERLADIESGDEESKLRRWLAAVSGGITADPRSITRRAAVSASSDTRIRGRRADEPGLIWSGVPIRNRNFTGRVALLDSLAEALRTGSTTSVLPQTLQGLGGVGKTQLVIEFVYQHLDQYDLVWWIPAEQTATVLTSLAQLAERLNVPTSEDRQETARTVLDALAGSDLAWLLVYDNADDPATLQHLLPSTGGHVIVTTRIQEWSKVGVSIEVDVFKREESMELLANRSKDVQGNSRITAHEADELADRLGDLPLALEQAVAWYLATAMPIREYIDLLDSHTKELLDEGKPANYPLTVAAFVSLAVEKLRAAAEATAQLFALFAYLGGEPIPLSLLRHGSKAAVTEPLRSILGASIPMNRTVRDLSRYGLAKVDPLQRIQVHRLVQRVLRDTLNAEQRAETLLNVQNLLAAANPGDPDEHGDWERQRDMGPHIEPADMIHSQTYASRQAMLDHSRYLYLSGDYENSRYLAELAASAWAAADDPELGPDGEQTLMARAQVANATRTLGNSTSAAAVMADTYPRFLNNPLLGRRHEFTLITGNQVGTDLRIAGRYQEALEFDLENVGLHREVFGPGETYTLRAEANLAVDYRMIGRFLEAQALDRQIAAHWEDVGAADPRALYAYMNLARSEYGLGAYSTALDRLERWRPVLQEKSSPGHSQVLLAGRTYAVTLRKAGRLAEAAEVMREIRDRTEKRFTPHHEFAVAATMSYANVLRQVDEVDEALRQITDALSRYRANFGESHPLTLVAQVNEAIARRARGELARAQALDAHCFDQLGRLLAPNHPYTICAGVSLATDYARAGEHEEALRLSRAMLELSREADRGAAQARDGAEHPYVLMRAINLSQDLRAVGAADAAEELLQESLAGLRQSLGADHPEVMLAAAGHRLEGDIEPPPT